jgi:hypothetical protein
MLVDVERDHDVCDNSCTTSTLFCLTAFIRSDVRQAATRVRPIKILVCPDLLIVHQTAVQRSVPPLRLLVGLGVTPLAFERQDGLLSLVVGSWRVPIARWRRCRRVGSAVVGRQETWLVDRVHRRTQAATGLGGGDTIGLRAQGIEEGHLSCRRL